MAFNYYISRFKGRGVQFGFDDTGNGVVIKFTKIMSVPRIDLLHT